MQHETHYLNTDLDITAPLDLTPLADALAGRGLYTFHVLPNQDGSWSARFETEEGFDEANANIAAMLTAIESLEEPARSLWGACTTRDFDIGYQCGKAPRWFIEHLTAATLARIAAAGAAVVITLYPLADTEPADAAANILKKDKSIKKHLGKYTGHGYGRVHLPRLKQQLAEVEMTLLGSKGSVFVHCIMALDDREEWIVKEILKKEEKYYPLAPGPDRDLAAPGGG